MAFSLRVQIWCDHSIVAMSLSLSANIRRQAEMRDGGNVGGLCGAVQKTTKKQRDILSRNNRVGVTRWRNGDRAWLIDLVLLQDTEDNKVMRAALSDIAKYGMPGRKFKVHVEDVMREIGA